ncbi:CPBP family intramembrane glutamic endopeptidase [Sphingobacterium sp. Mn56C]|uniref:CPBP family intramembrane glutamic endopeptidase n=1 Tax=Sphingobacterium sp. Mn56C TaxID=3395261 RepID=UPI003BD3D147
MLLVVLSPLAETICCQDIVYRITKNRCPKKYSVLLSALLFGFLHLGSYINGYVPAFLTGAFLMTLYIIAFKRTKKLSILSVYSAHALHNLTSLIFYYLCPNFSP